MQELVQHTARHGLDGLALLGIEPFQAAPLPFELGQTHGLDALPQGADGRCHLAGGDAVDESLALLVDDGAHPPDLAPALGQTGFNERPHVIEVEQLHAG